ncbi:lebercilin-like protein isoform X2 [Etheostoma spectabile]|uniref:lebercilin-like protein isoform X2 n=1 Tax=Etheostoma spectabile TaxID=54343 RepID=UPI0013AF7603|nr:lebercilin-like protein isoform X2 [Etheostoma spectabile]
MSVRRQGLMQQAFEHKEGDGDAVSCSTNTSRWSSPSRLGCGSNSSHYSPDFEDQADSLTGKNPEVKTSDKWQASKTCGRKKGKKAQGPHSQKTNKSANRQVPTLPPIKPMQVSKSADLNCIKELKSQVGHLQQQLSEATTENKLLKRLQLRHTVALQHFQDSEGSLSQILIKHSNEVRVLQGLLRDTRACRENLARQLQTTENKLLSAKASLKHLQLLSQDHSLQEREELTFRLTRAYAELEDKDKRILDLEKNLELCHASFNRQIVTEERKTNEARKISCYLQEQIYQLNKEVQDRKRKLETHNIYSHRASKTGSGSKKVQTDGLVLLPTAAASLLELEHMTEERLEEQESSEDWSLVIEKPEAGVSANVTLEENRQECTETCADTSEHGSSSEASPEYQIEGESDEEKEASEAPQVLKLKAEEHESETSYILKKSLNETKPKRKGHKLPKIRHNYTFKQSIENLHSGRPAYNRVDLSPCQSAKSPIKLETLSSGIHDLCLQAGKSRVDGVCSPQDK